MDWKPTTSIAALKKRAQIISKIRQFFAQKEIYEVETPLLCRGTVPSPYIESFISEHKYLQTSPEFAMKRLLAAGSGSIYQICKAFRLEEAGKLHNPEFTILEWYRVDYTYHQLMHEVAELLTMLFHCGDCDFITYYDLFMQHLRIDPFVVTFQELKNIANKYDFYIELDQKDEYFDLLLSHLIEPKLGNEKPVFIYDFPASQSALAQIRQDEPPIAERFEVYFKGIELANGFQELNSSDEQRQRFEDELQQRRKQQQSITVIDERFLQSLNQLPSCAGVAIGVDRLIMLSMNADTIKSVLSFDYDNA